MVLHVCECRWDEKKIWEKKEIENISQVLLFIYFFGLNDFLKNTKTSGPRSQEKKKNLMDYNHVLKVFLMTWIFSSYQISFD